MVDILIDTIIDALKIFPFLFLAFLLIEFLEHKMNEKQKNVIKKSNKFGPFIGSSLGVFPQCGFSALITNLYIVRVVSLGTLIAVYLSTSDEMLPIMLSSNAPIGDILFLLSTKWIVGIVFGVIIDLIMPKKNIEIHDMCKHDHCDCEHENIFISSLKHTIGTVVLIFIITLILNYIFSIFDEDTISKIFLKDSAVSVFISPIIGLIPSCAASVTITELYLSGVIKVSTCIAGLLTGSGTALLVLIKNNKEKCENLKIIGLLYLIGATVGLILYLFGL